MSAPVAGLWMAFVWAVQAPEAPRIQEYLKKYVARTYDCRIGEQKNVTWMVRAAIREVGGRDFAVLEGLFEIPARGGLVERVTMGERARLSRLRLVASARTGDWGDWSVSTEGATATIKQGGRERSVEITDATVGELGLMHLVAAAEQKVDASFKADYLHIATGELQREVALRCVSREVIEVGGKRVDAFRWTRVRAGPVSDYWVSPEGVLLKMSGAEIDAELKRE